MSVRPAAELVLGLKPSSCAHTRPRNFSDVIDKPRLLNRQSRPAGPLSLGKHEKGQSNSSSPYNIDKTPS